MSFREFKDRSGARWEVWEVRPALLERRVEDQLPVDGNKRISGQRRAAVAPELRFGWLVFESAGAKRRLAPVPEGWDSLDDVGLEGLLDQAHINGRPRIALSGDDTFTAPPVQSVSSGPS